MSADVLERPVTSDVDATDDPRVAHLVLGKAALTEAYIMGTPVTALCGAVFVLTRDPERFPVCQGCFEEAKRRGLLEGQ
jgi:hypothetical protein